MTSLIAILIALLGYGSPSDYEGYTEDQLKAKIAEVESTNSTDEGGGWDDWDDPSVTPEPEP